MSLDGFVAGPSQSVDNPLGIGVERLHRWAFQLAVFRSLLGLELVRMVATPAVTHLKLARR